MSLKHIDVIIPVCKTLPYLDDLFNSIYNLDTAGLHVHWFFVVDFATAEQVQREAGYVTAQIGRMRTWARFNTLWDYDLTACGENQGLGEARNIGIAKGSSPYVCWFDSDDLFTPDSLVGRIKYMEEHAEVDCGYGTYWTFKGDFTESIGNWGDPEIQPFTYPNLFRENQFHPCSTIIRRDKFEPFPKSVRVAEDYAWALKIARKIRFAYIEDVRVLYYRLRGDSLSTASEAQKLHYPNIIKIKREIWCEMPAEDHAQIQEAWTDGGA